MLCGMHPENIVNPSSDIGLCAPSLQPTFLILVHGNIFRFKQL